MKTVTQLQAKYLLILFFIGWITYSALFGEHIEAYNGLGWDGKGYAFFTQQFPYLIRNHQLSDYTIHRVLPSAFIHFFFRILHIPLNEANILKAFEILNSILLILAVILWQKIASRLNWNPTVQLISFAGLFLNYAMLKYSGYYPALTDISGFFLGILMFYGYFYKKDYLVLVCGIAGAFVFPTLLYSALILYIFPLQQVSNYTILRPYFAIPMGCLMGILVTGICLYMNRVMNFVSVGNDYASHMVFYLSAAILFSYVALITSSLVKHTGIIFKNSHLSTLIRLSVAFIITVSLSTLIGHASTGGKDSFTPYEFLGHISAQALAYPFVFIISHIIFYGPIIALFIFLWRDVIHYLTQKATGLFILLCLCLALSIGSESRQFITFFPLCVILVAEVLNTYKISWKFSYSLVILCLIVSRFWLPLNHGSWPSLMQNPPEITLKFPMQWYFMSQGPWMSHAMYVVNLIIASITFCLIYFMIRSLRAFHRDRA